MFNNAESSCEVDGYDCRGLNVSFRPYRSYERAGVRTVVAHLGIDSGQLPEIKSSFSDLAPNKQTTGVTFSAWGHSGQRKELTDRP
jgi:hypothetical protein